MNNVCQYEGKTLGRLENLSVIDLSTRGWSHIMQNQVNNSYSFFEKKVDTRAVWLVPSKSVVVGWYSRY